MFCCISPNEEQMPPRLTEDQKRLVQEIWQQVRHEIEEVGVESFLKFFATHPEAMDSFLVFREIGIKDLETHVKLKEHALKVTSIVDKCVARIDDPKSFEVICRDQGLNHVGRRVTEEFQRSLRDKYIDAIRSRSTIEWTQEHQKAWETFFNILQQYMMETMNQAYVRRAKQQ